MSFCSLHVYVHENEFHAGIKFSSHEIFQNKLLELIRVKQIRARRTSSSCGRSGPRNDFHGHFFCFEGTFEVKDLPLSLMFLLMNSQADCCSVRQMMLQLRNNKGISYYNIYLYYISYIIKVLVSSLVSFCLNAPSLLSEVSCRAPHSIIFSTLISNLESKTSFF